VILQCNPAKEIPGTGRKTSVGRIIIFAMCVFLAFPPLAAHARKLSAEENEALCERYGDSLERKFSASPQALVQELDALIVKVGTLGPDRVNHDKSGRMLASIATPSARKEARRREASRETSALEIRVHHKLTEANRVLTQSKRIGFFDEDEERSIGVQEACARVIYDRASILERMTRHE
jgi:hypothetical protein